MDEQVTEIVSYDAPIDPPFQVRLVNHGVVVLLLLHRAGLLLVMVVLHLERGVVVLELLFDSFPRNATRVVQLL